MRQLPGISFCITSLGAESGELRGLPNILKQIQKYFNVSLWETLNATDMFGSQPAFERIKSINWAAEKGDLVMAWNGGYNSIELFQDFDKIRMPKETIFLGYSDNTLLVNALPAAGVCRAWQGPMLANFVKTPGYVSLWLECLQALYRNDYTTVSSLYNQLGVTVFRPGLMEGRVWGGNNYTFDLLQGTSFCPSFENPYILLLEGEDFINDKGRIWQDFIRNLDSIMLLPGAQANLCGLLIGKFPASYKPDKREMAASFNMRAYLRNIPIAYDIPRGYYAPSLYLPIGEPLSIVLAKNNAIQLDRL